MQKLLDLTILSFKSVKLLLFDNRPFKRGLEIAILAEKPFPVALSLPYAYLIWIIF